MTHHPGLAGVFYRVNYDGLDEDIGRHRYGNDADLFMACV